MLDIFRMGELIAPSDVEKRIFRMCMQDEARHVAYGTMHLRYAVDHDPDVAEEIHEALDHGEQVLIDFGTAPDVSTALAVLLAGGVEHVEDKGFPLSMELTKKQLTSYLARCERAGVSRLDRTTIPLDMLGIDPEPIRAASDGGPMSTEVDTIAFFDAAGRRDERPRRALRAAWGGRDGSSYRGAWAAQTGTSASVSSSSVSGAAASPRPTTPRRPSPTSAWRAPSRPGRRCSTTSSPTAAPPVSTRSTAWRLMGDRICCQGDDPMGLDKFSRFNQTLPGVLRRRTPPGGRRQLRRRIDGCTESVRTAASPSYAALDLPYGWWEWRDDGYQLIDCFAAGRRRTVGPLGLHGRAPRVPPPRLRPTQSSRKPQHVMSGS